MGTAVASTDTEDRKFCAVKFFAELGGAVSEAIAERDRWNEIYGDVLPEARVVTFPAAGTAKGTDDFICMPYLVDRKTALESGEIERCLKALAAKNYHHNEIKWRHLGRFRCEDEQMKVFLSDLAPHGLEERSEETDDAVWQAKNCCMDRAESQHWKSAGRDNKHAQK